MGCTSRNSDDESLPGRGRWTHKLDYMLSLIGYSVGLGNLWRFPYVCMKNGGGAFLIPFIVCLVIFALPIFFLETSAGQFMGRGCRDIFEICPLLKGLGYSMVIVLTVFNFYYNTINAWILYYIGSSFITPLPWTTCNNEWNSVDCISDRGPYVLSNNQTVTNVTSFKYRTHLILANSTDQGANQTWVSAQEEFWRNNVLQMSSGIYDLGGLNWRITLCMLAAWFLVCLCVIKGVKSVGKVVYVTAVLPYIILTVLLVRGLTLDGSVDGVIYYVKPDFEKVLSFQVWVSAAIQVFYSIGLCAGALISLSSFNKFKNNFLWDTVILTFVCEGTSIFAGFVIFSILGFMAKKFSIPISEVVKSGPGLGFVAYPEALGLMPGQNVWAVLFFVMLLSLGLDSRFGGCESVIVVCTDSWPILRKHRSLFSVVFCVFHALVGLIFCSQAGIYIFQIVDWYCAFSLPIIGFTECIIFGWIYGTERFSQDIKLMIGRDIPVYYRICICFITPIFLIIIFISGIVAYKAPTLGDYIYPDSAVALGFIIALVPILPIPIFALLAIKSAHGRNIKEKFLNSLRPSLKWKPIDETCRLGYKYLDCEGTLLEKFKLNVMGD